MYFFDFPDEIDDHHPHRNEEEKGSSDPLAIGLSVAIVLFGMVLVLAIALYYFIRRGISISCLERGRGSRGDIQELTTQTRSNNHANSSTVIASSDVDHQSFGYDNNLANFNGSATNFHDIRNESMIAANQRLEGLKSNVWTIPRNFLELTHEVVGRGKFGSVIKAMVNNRGQKMIKACVQVIPGRNLTYKAKPELKER